MKLCVAQAWSPTDLPPGITSSPSVKGREGPFLRRETQRKKGSPHTLVQVSKEPTETPRPYTAACWLLKHTGMGVARGRRAHEASPRRSGGPGHGSRHGLLTRTLAAQHSPGTVSQSPGVNGSLVIPKPDAPPEGPLSCPDGAPSPRQAPAGCACCVGAAGSSPATPPFPSISPVSPLTISSSRENSSRVVPLLQPEAPDLRETREYIFSSGL